jgi:urease accessory protein
MLAASGENIPLSSPIFVKEAEPIEWSIGSTANFSLPPDRVGRDGLLCLRFARLGDRTILARRRWTHPLQALDPVQAHDGSVSLMVLNTSGGLVGGDRLRTVIDLEAYSSAVLLTASANKIYRSAGPIASDGTVITLQRGATIEYLPDHLIPHPGARYEQSLRVEMGPGSKAIICDSMAVGRLGRGERWQFDELRSERIISSDSRLIYLNRSCIRPVEFSLCRLGLAEDFNYIASLVMIGDGCDWEGLSSELSDELERLEGIFGGVAQLRTGGCVVRFMSYSAADLNRTVHQLWKISRPRLLGLKAFDPRKI